MKEKSEEFEWCHDCKEYDQENHCCHRWSKVIRDTVEEMKQEQEPITKNDLVVDCISRADARKAIIDHQYSANFCEEHNIDHSINTSMALIALSDLPSVTPQEPFINKPCVSSGVCEHDKNKALEKIRAEIVELWQNEPCAIEGGCLDEILEIIDKYKADRSVEE